MAYIAKTAFEVKISNHEFDSIANITGIYQDSGANAVCSAGMLCVRDALTVNEGYTAIKNGNTWTMKAAAAADTSVPIYACNPFDVNIISDPVTGAAYKVGSNTLGLPAPAGYPTTYTQIQFNGVNVYRFGEGNLSAAISTNTFFTIANGLLVPAAAAPSTAGTPYFQLRGTGNFTQGNRAGFVYYDVVAMMS